MGSGSPTLANEFLLPAIASIVVGGTGLYLRVLEAGIAPVPAIPDDVRVALRAAHAERGDLGLHRMLAERDPESAARLAPADVHRVLRALEVIALTGRLVLGIFGADYAAEGYAALVVLCLAGLSLIIKDHHVALARVTDDVGRESLLVTMLSVVEVFGAAYGAVRGGLTGLALGWLAAVSLGAVVYGPRVLRAYRGRVEVPA